MIEPNIDNKVTQEAPAGASSVIDIPKDQQEKLIQNEAEIPSDPPVDKQSSSRRKLYDGVSEHVDIGDFESFNKAIDDPVRRNKFYNEVSKHIDIGTYDYFVDKVSTTPDEDFKEGDPAFTEGGHRKFDDEYTPSFSVDDYRMIATDFSKGSDPDYKMLAEKEGIESAERYWNERQLETAALNNPESIDYYNHLSGLMIKEADETMGSIPDYIEMKKGEYADFFLEEEGKKIYDGINIVKEARSDVEELEKKIELGEDVETNKHLLDLAKEDLKESEKEYATNRFNTYKGSGKDIAAYSKALKENTISKENLLSAIESVHGKLSPEEYTEQFYEVYNAPEDDSIPLYGQYEKYAPIVEEALHKGVKSKEGFFKDKREETEEAVLDISSFMGDEFKRLVPQGLSPKEELGYMYTMMIKEYEQRRLKMSRDVAEGKAPSDMETIVKDMTGLTPDDLTRFRELEQKLKNYAPIFYLDENPFEKVDTGFVSGIADFKLDVVKQGLKAMFPTLTSQTTLQGKAEVQDDFMQSTLGQKSAGLIGEEGSEALSDRWDAKTGKAKDVDSLTDMYFYSNIAGNTVPIMVDLAVGSHGAKGVLGASRWGRGFMKIAEDPRLMNKFLRIQNASKRGGLLGKVYGTLGAKATKHLLGATQAGLNYQMAGTMFPGKMDELNFGTGLFGYTGAATVNAMANKLPLVRGIANNIARIFGDDAPRISNMIKSAGAKMRNRVGSGIGEAAEETSQQLTQAFLKSVNGQSFFKEAEDQFGSMDDFTKTLVASFILGGAMGGSALGETMMRDVDKKLIKLDNENQKIFRNVVAQMKMESDLDIEEKVERTLEGEEGIFEMSQKVGEARPTETKQTIKNPLHDANGEVLTDEEGAVLVSEQSPEYSGLEGTESPVKMIEDYRKEVDEELKGRIRARAKEIDADAETEANEIIDGWEKADAEELQAAEDQAKEDIKKEFGGLFGEGVDIDEEMQVGIEDDFVEDASQYSTEEEGDIEEYISNEEVKDGGKRKPFTKEEAATRQAEVLEQIEEIKRKKAESKKDLKEGKTESTKEVVYNHASEIESEAVNEGAENMKSGDQAEEITEAHVEGQVEAELNTGKTKEDMSNDEPKIPKRKRKSWSERTRDKLSGVREVSEDSRIHSIISDKVGYFIDSMPAGFRRGVEATKKGYSKYFKITGLWSRHAEMEAGYDYVQDATQRIATSNHEANKIAQALTKEFDKEFKKNKNKEETLSLIDDANDYLYGRSDGSKLPSKTRALLNDMMDTVRVLNNDLHEAGLVKREITPEMQANGDVYMATSYAKHLNNDYIQTVDQKVIDDAVESIKRQAKEEGKPVTDEEAEGIAHMILWKGAGSGRFTSNTKAELSRVQTGNLKNKMESDKLSKEVKALLGEMKNPVFNFLNTVNIQSQMLHRNEMLGRIHDLGVETGNVIPSERGEKGAEGKKRKFTKKAKPTATNKIKLEGKSWGKLDGSMVTPEIAEILNDVSSKTTQNSAIWSAIVKTVSTWKAVNTTYNVASNVVNFAGAGFNFTSQGGDLKGRSVQKAWDALKNEWSENPSELTKTLGDLGILNTGANVGEMMETIEAAGLGDNNFEFLYDPESKWEKASVKTKKKFKTAKQFFERTYQSGDNFWRTMSYFREYDRYMKTDPEYKANAAKFGDLRAEAMFKESSKHAELQKKAANIVKNTFPTYSKLPKAVEMLRKFPAFTTFVSYPIESIRTSFNTINLAAAEINNKEADPDVRKQIRKIGINRMSGVIATQLFFYGLQAATAAAFLPSGKREDNEELLPEYDKNSTKFYLPSVLGKVNYINTSRYNPFGYGFDAIFTMMKALTTQDSVPMVEAAQTLADPFTTENPVGARLFDIFIRHGETAKGKRVYNPEESTFKKTYKGAAHLADVFDAGTFRALSGVFKSIYGKKKANGDDYNMGVEMMKVIGASVRQMDNDESAAYKFKSLKTRLDDAKNIFNTDKYTTTVDNYDKLAEETNESVEPIVKEMTKVVNALRNMGRTDEEIVSLLTSGSGIAKPKIPKAVAERLVDGDEIKYTPDENGVLRLVEEEDDSDFESYW